uniref:Uncharacterized protein AlNc14C1169G12823 n=1 Tax=Albugo laibachii Nc14 TaxID=890382 RepID=F0X2K3_9STRA|nr:conserved hypothetical protein [Albugo laibachii Nc14]|eukprot:CCA28110.1 conserved hypothetical protein [Albugo laibachii Nc14]
MANESPIALYDALQRIKRRKVVVSLSSSDEDSDIETTALASRQSRNQGNVILSVEEDTIESTSEEHIRETLQQDDQITKEIDRELDDDKALQRTRALIDHLVSIRNAPKNQCAVPSCHDEIIVMDSENEDEEHTCIQQRKKRISSSTQIAVTSPDIVLKIHSVEKRIDHVTIPMHAPSLDALYTVYGDLHGLLIEELQFTYKGVMLTVEQSPSKLKMRSGDVIEATVRPKSLRQVYKKRYVQLWLSVNGTSDEEIHIQADLPLKQLQETICEKHRILDPSSIVMVIDGEVLDLLESAEFYGLMNEDRISVVAKESSDLRAVSIQLRFQNGEIESASVVPIYKVATLMQKLAEQKTCKTTSFALRIDGETMNGDRCFQDYDIEGGELIEVCAI